MVCNIHCKLKSTCILASVNPIFIANSSLEKKKQNKNTIIHYKMNLNKMHSRFIISEKKIKIITRNKKELKTRLRTLDEINYITL